MVLALLAFLGGALTIISPCILPVLPFVFARQGKPFSRSTLPLLIGMALTFAGIATLAAVGGAWAVRVNTYGRALALVLLAAFGVALLSKRVADWLARPFVALGNRLVQSSAPGSDAGGVAQYAVLGVATGFLWAPCAGPILGLILTGAAINGPSTQTTSLLLAYALGAVTSLALATLVGGRILGAFRSSLGAGEWLRRSVGVLVLVAVVAITLGWDTGLLTRLSLAGTNKVEQSIIDAIRGPTNAEGNSAAMAMNGGDGMTAGGAMTGPSMSGDSMRSGDAMTGPSMSGDSMMSGDAMTSGEASDRAMTGGAMAVAARSDAPPVEGQLPSLDGAVGWLNSAPLTSESLRGKVVVIDFWTYSCINCLRTLPYVRAWHDRYADKGLVIIGVHTPEFAFEKEKSNVQRAVRELRIRYPVAIDNDYAIWRAFNNEYWPAHYFIDAQGRVRGHHFGEGAYDESEKLIRKLLAEAGHAELPAAASASMQGQGVEVAADENNIASPETYIGYERAENFTSPGGFETNRVKAYSTPSALRLNQWGLGGRWTVAGESAVAQTAGTTVTFRFHARDLHLVLGPSADGKPVRFRVSIDGREPAGHHGADVDEHGLGVVREQRLYQLIRQSDGVSDRTFTIEFLDPGAHAYAFTFG